MKRKSEARLLREGLIKIMALTESSLGYDSKEMHDALNTIFRIAHYLCDKSCRKNHPRWERECYLDEK